MPFDRYYVKIDDGRFLRGACSEVNDTEEALPYVMLGEDSSMDLLWGDSIVKGGEFLHTNKLQSDGRTAPFYVFSNITDLTIIGGTYIACDPHQALSSMEVVNGLGVSSLFSLFSHITHIEIKGGDFTAVYTDDPKEFSSLVKAQYEGQEHNFAVFQNITHVSIIGGTFISVQSADLSCALPSSITTMPHFQLFRHITTIDIVGATFNIVFPSTTREGLGQDLQPPAFFDRVTTVNVHSTRFFEIKLQDYIQRRKRAGAGGVTINNDSNNKTKVSMRNVGNGDVNFHIHYGEISFTDPSASHTERHPHREEPLSGQSSSGGSMIGNKKRQDLHIMIARLLALMHDDPTASNDPNISQLTDTDPERDSESLLTTPPLRSERQASRKRPERSDKADVNTRAADPLHDATRYVSAWMGTDLSENTPTRQPEHPHPKQKGSSGRESSPQLQERLITIHPLILPPNGEAKVAAHQLATLYFTAVLHAVDIPDFEAEYVYHDGKCTSILLILETAFNAERVKLAWDRTRREELRVSSLADVLLYRGNVATKILAQLDRDAALDELGSYIMHDSP